MGRLYDIRRPLRVRECLTGTGLDSAGIQHRDRSRRHALWPRRVPLLVVSTTKKPAQMRTDEGDRIPGAAGMAGLAAAVRSFPDKLPPIVLALLTGLNASAVGLIALAAYQLSNGSVTDAVSRIVLVGCASFGICYHAPWVSVIRSSRRLLAGARCEYQKPMLTPLSRCTLFSSPAEASSPFCTTSATASSPAFVPADAASHPHPHRLPTQHSNCDRCQARPQTWRFRHSPKLVQRGDKNRKIPARNPETRRGSRVFASDIPSLRPLPCLSLRKHRPTNVFVRASSSRRKRSPTPSARHSSS